ncbi:hypothetical protein [Cellulomonas chengniuliangii]|uniref:Uncharacterized protein n=1 Tax=Cellulomonas chengniuliangii TaxID=2968084 RepID=A0ABY5KVY2_9CELL|nr:hypothetical protein [Cellulomonas chengniuliangii]MCC2308526.1 hypothetical protein [Cellulomonas chengniuliangii]MCC2317543.1 hypothetical protein [Cellulomonas chengniuliangii]UUI73890.1 hypothetical protein NP064_08505 [Cellulomonas chengniuliangii]
MCSQHPAAERSADAHTPLAESKADDIASALRYLRRVRGMLPSTTALRLIAIEEAELRARGVALAAATSDLPHHHDTHHRWRSPATAPQDPMEAPQMPGHAPRWKLRSSTPAGLP